MPKLVLHALVLSARGRLIRSCRGNCGWLAAHGSPESGLTLRSAVLNKVEVGFHLAVVLLDSLSDFTGLSLLKHVSLSAEPAVKLETEVKHEAVTLVEGVTAHGNREDTRVSLTFNLKKARLIDLGLNVTETTIDSSFKVEKTGFEIAHEKICLHFLLFQMMS